MNNWIHFGICCLLFFGGSAALLGQAAESRNMAIAYYKDGSVFIGPIVDEGAYSLSMVISTGDTILIDPGQIRKLLRGTDDIIIRNRGRFFYTKGTFATFSLGVGGGDDNTSHLDLMIGRRLNEKVSLALGTGLHYNSFFFGNFWADSQFIPLYGYGRYYMGRRNPRFFFYGSAGYGFPAGTLFFGTFTGGVQAQAGVGVNWASRKKIRWLISLGQTFQHVRGTANSTDIFSQPVVYDYNLWLNRIIFKLGIEFR